MKIRFVNFEIVALSVATLIFIIDNSVADIIGCFIMIALIINKAYKEYRLYEKVDFTLALFTLIYTIILILSIVELTV